MSAPPLPRKRTLCGVLLGLALASCSSEQPAPASPATWSLLVDLPAVEAWQAQALDVPSASVSIEGTGFEPWTLEHGSDAAVTGELFTLQAARGAALHSPASFELDARLVDAALVSLDGGDARGTSFHLDWENEHGESGRRTIFDKATGLQTFRVLLRDDPTWRDRIVRVTVRPLVGDEGARIRLGTLLFAGRFAELARRGAGRAEVVLAGEERPVLFSAVSAPQVVPIGVPPGARLHLGLGALGLAREVRCRVSARHAGETSVLLERAVAPGLAWSDHVVDLAAYAGLEVELLFEASSADANSPTLACWSDPILRWGASRPPNVFVYLVDTLRPDHLTPYGYDAQLTPRLSALAERSVLFEHCVAQSNWTKSSMPSLMTSTYLAQHGVPHLGATLPEDLTTLAEAMRARGYRTASFLTNRLAGRASGLQRGFSTLVESTLAQEFEHDPLRSLPAGVLPWIEDHAQEPLFVYVHTAEPHDPYEPPAAYLGASDYAGPATGQNFTKVARSDADVQHVISLYDGEVRFMDSALGGFLDALTELGLFEPSYFVFTSDHGEAFLEHGRWTHRANLYHHQVDIPLIVHLPGDHLGGTRRSDVVRSIDIMPTLLGGVGVEFPGSVQGEGLFAERREPRDFPVRGALTEGSLAAKAGAEGLEFAYRTERWKVILGNPPQGAESVEVYDLRADPGEQSPLAEPYPQLPRDILSALRQWRDDHAGSRRRSEADGGVRDLGYLDELRALGYAGEDE